jgi:hypothetical protein
MPSGITISGSVVVVAGVVVLVVVLVVVVDVVVVDVVLDDAIAAGALVAVAAVDGEDGMTSTGVAAPGAPSSAHDVTTAARPTSATANRPVRRSLPAFIFRW